MTVSADKMMVRAKGPLWRQKDKRKGQMPEGLRGVDKEATWSFSKAYGWVYGHGTFCLTSHYGNMRANPTYLRNMAFSGDPQIQVPWTLSELIKTGMIESYTVRGQRYLHVRNWTKHQKIDRPGKPKVPTPEEADQSSPVEMKMSFVSRDVLEEKGPHRF